MFAPAKTPERSSVGSIKRSRARSAARYQREVLSTGVEAVGGSPKEFAAAIKSDMARMGKVIKDAGIRAD